MGRLRTSLAGLGGSVKFLRADFRAKQYYPLTEKFIGSLGVRGGYIQGLGDDVRIVDRFFFGRKELTGV